MRTVKKLTLPALTAVASAAITLLPAIAAASEAWTRETIPIGSKKMPYLCNRPLAATNSAVTRAIIVIHGGYRIPEEYFAPILAMMPTSPDPARDWRRRTMVLAPHFQERRQAPGGEHWWDGHWREGGESDGVSSYKVVDTMVGLLRCGTFPNLKWVIICGHSAGGQFTQRYAAFTDTDLQPAPNARFIKFVPANPSSYVYLNEFRPGPDHAWIIPEECSSGDHYNEWKYGLDGLYGYTATRGASWARNRFPKRQVELLAGTADVVVDADFDADCAAMRQGPTRYGRAHNFGAFMDRFYPTNRFKLTDVPGVGHNGPLMFSSPQGRSALFFAD